MPISVEPLNHVDLIFPAMGAAIPRQHGHALYGAMSRVVPWLHTDDAKREAVGISPIRGDAAGDGTLLLNARSTVRVRVPAARLPALLPLAGQLLELDGFRLRLGVPRVAGLVPAAVLASPLVLIKIAHVAGKDTVTPELFLASARRKLAELGVEAEPALQLIRHGPRAGQVRRRVVRVREQTHVGFAMVVSGLTAEESVALQSAAWAGGG